MQTQNAIVTPEGQLEVLSQHEVSKLMDNSKGGLYDIYRRCSLAVLNCGSEIDDSKYIFEQFRDFEIQIHRRDRGIKLAVINAPGDAFVDGEMIKGIKEHLFVVLRDILYIGDEVIDNTHFDLDRSEDTTNAVFHILRNAGVLWAQHLPDMVVCWGGHSIGRAEYDYSKEVGYELGLRGMNVCTGCGPGAMKGPMKGAAIGHAKQRIYEGRYVGITEPGIIAAEPPNPIVNELVIMPDIEKRLEAFLRLGHGIIVFPGGVGTAEEILHLLGVLLNPENAELPFPVIFTGPRQAADYFRQIDDFIATTLGHEAQKLYSIIIEDSQRVASEMKRGMEDVCDFRKANQDAFYFNWLLKVEKDFQTPFEPTHDNMATLDLGSNQPPHALAANLRRAFSGIVAGNIKEPGMLAIDKYGPYELSGDRKISKPLDLLLGGFAAERRMKLPGPEYNPCYKIVV